MCIYKCIYIHIYIYICDICFGTPWICRGHNCLTCSRGDKHKNHTGLACWHPTATKPKGLDSRDSDTPGEAVQMCAATVWDVEPRIRTLQEGIQAQASTHTTVTCRGITFLFTELYPNSREPCPERKIGLAKTGAQVKTNWASVGRAGNCHTAIQVLNEELQLFPWCWGRFSAQKHSQSRCSPGGLLTFPSLSKSRSPRHSGHSGRRISQHHKSLTTRSPRTDQNPRMCAAKSRKACRAFLDCRCCTSPAN